MIEYSIARLSAKRSRFIKGHSLEKIMGLKDGRSLFSILEESVFKEETDAIIARGESCIKVPTALRVLNQGQLRLRRFVSQLTISAFPNSYAAILSRWELEEIKAALRYLASSGSMLERRFRFTSYIMGAKATEVWKTQYSAPDFISYLKKNSHPLAGLFDPSLYAQDSVKAELDMERKYFQSYLPGKIARIESAKPYFANQLDLVNTHYALLLREGVVQDADELELFYIRGMGRLSFSDFKKMLTAPFSQVTALLERKLRLRLGPIPDLTPSRLSLEVKKSFLRRYRAMNIVESGGIWSFLSFMDELDSMLADLKFAIYFGAMGASYKEASGHFMGLKAE